MKDGTGGPQGPGKRAEELNELLAVIWHQIARQVNTLIEAHDTFGFLQFNANLNPSLAEMIEALSFIDFALKKFVDSGKLEEEEFRNAINSRQCILKMKGLSLALEAHDEAEYQRIMEELRKQRKD